MVPRAPSRTVGAGQEYDRPSSSDGCLPSRGEQNHHQHRFVNPSPHSRLCPLLPLRRTNERLEKANSVIAGPLTGVHAHRWVDAPPSSGSAVGPLQRL
jgi:hypothetical protein